MTPRNLGIRDKWIEMTERKGSETDSSERTRFVGCELEGSRTHHLNPHRLAVN